MTTAAETLRALHTAAPVWNDLYARVEAAEAAGDVAFLCEVLDGLSLTEPATRPAWSPAAHLAEVAFRAFARVPGFDAARALVLRARVCRQRSLVAAALAQTHPVETLAALVATPAPHPSSRALLAAWMHEAVYHGAAASSQPSLVALAASLRAEGDPLGRAPLTLTALETSMTRRPPVVRPRSYGSWGLMPERHDLVDDPRPAAALDVAPLRDDAWAARVRGAFVPAGTVSNAKVEARRYLLSSPLDPALLGAPVLRALAPDCVTAPTPPDDVDDDTPPPHDPATVAISTCDGSPAALAATLLHTAVGWRCYGEYAGVGPGRARAFDALAALCDLPDDTPWEDVSRALSTRRVVRFVTDARWYDHVCEDLGFLVLDPTGEVLTLVAETDSD